MPISVSRLRRWFAAGAILVCLMVAGAYFYARYRVRNALKEIPEKIGLEIQQSAQGFTISKSEEGRTLFKVQASRAVQFKETGRAELHDVSIVLYGRDASRFDQIYGSDFEYDPKSGDVIAKGEVQIDLEANPAGLSGADQAPPRELKNPIHLRTSGLVFNQKSGNAYTKEKIEFSIPQASGSALGATYSGKTNVLTLDSQLRVTVNGDTPGVIEASRGVLSKMPRQVVLLNPRMVRGPQTVTADQANLLLNSENTVEQVLAVGNVNAASLGKSPTRVRANQLELELSGPKNNLLHSAVLSGEVQAESLGAQPAEASAGRVVLSFSGKNVLTRIHAEQRVRLIQRQNPVPAGHAAPQNVVVTSPAIDFLVAAGNRLRTAETAGDAQIEISPGGATQASPTMVTAAKFEARFDSQGRIQTVHGAPQARITSSTPGSPDRVSSSDVLDITFRQGAGIESLVQQGNLAYVDGDRKAWADRARYTPADQMLTLTGSPRVVEGGMTTTAVAMRINRATGDAIAEKDVKSTYSDLKPQPGGALLASSSPIHVTAQTMTAHRSPATATYSGNARLWQDANVIQAPVIEFDREHRAVSASGNSSQPVTSVIVQSDKSGKLTPVTVSSARLSYADGDRKAHYEGGVVVKGADLTVTARQMDISLQVRGQNSGSAPLGGAGQLDRMVAQGNVVITQPQRQATGDQLVYTASDDKFVLSGGLPSIFDAEHGKITGVSLTFYRRDDRVVVEGRDSSPTVTRTRVAR
jgi:lipopolysaccharide export system protein LptA